MADNTEKLIKAGEYIIDTAEILSRLGKLIKGNK